MSAASMEDHIGIKRFDSWPNTIKMKVANWRLPFNVFIPGDEVVRLHTFN